MYVTISALISFPLQLILTSLQRDMVPLGASPNALPEFPDDESWYYHVSIGVSYIMIPAYRYHCTRLGYHAMLNFLAYKLYRICT